MTVRGTCVNFSNRNITNCRRNQGFSCFLKTGLWVVTPLFKLVPVGFDSWPPTLGIESISRSQMGHRASWALVQECTIQKRPHLNNATLSIVRGWLLTLKNLRVLGSDWIWIFNTGCHLSPRRCRPQRPSRPRGQRTPGLPGLPGFKFGPGCRLQPSSSSYIPESCAKNPTSNLNWDNWGSTQLQAEPPSAFLANSNSPEKVILIENSAMRAAPTLRRDAAAGQTPSHTFKAGMTPNAFGISLGPHAPSPSPSATPTCRGSSR